jgi:hypothetical protein
MPSNFSIPDEIEPSDERPPALNSHEMSGSPGDIMIFFRLPKK